MSYSFDPMDCVASQAALSMGFFRQEYWSGLPFLPPGHLLDPGIEPAFPVFPALATEPPGKSIGTKCVSRNGIALSSGFHCFYEKSFIAHTALLLLSCLRLCNPTDCSTPGFPVLHYLPEFAQSHVD